MRRKIDIRDFTPGDTERILEFREETARTSFPGIRVDRKNARSAILSHESKHPGTIKVAESAGKPVGYIMFRPRKGTLGRHGYIDIIFVHKAYRDHGVGALLLEEAEKWFSKKGIKRINATITDTNKHSRDFFRENGYSDSRVVVEKRI